MKPLCFVLMPFGRKMDDRGRLIDFDAIYRQVIAPAVVGADMEPIRADDEQVGGAIHKPMYERLILCDYALADVTGANPNVYYELGIRHAVRPRSTLIVFAAGVSLPFDIAPLRGMPYSISDAGLPDAVDKDLAAMTARLQAARREEGDDSPLFQLVEGMPRMDVDHSKTDVFRAQVAYSRECKEQLAQARRDGPAAVIAFAQGPAMEDMLDVEAGVVVDLLLSFRAVKAHEEMVALVPKMTTPLKRTRLVREQLGFALNKLGRRAEAEVVLREVIEEYGPSSETNALLGAVFKEAWKEAQARHGLEGRGFLKKAVGAYLEGFEADWRDPYPGVNAVTLMEMLEPADPRQGEILPVVRYSASRRAARGGDYWDFATLMELAVIARDPDGAADAAGSALAVLAEPWQAESTAHNLAIIRQQREARGGEDVAWIAELETQLMESARRMAARTPAVG